jgi:uncharacterized protein
VLTHCDRRNDRFAILDARPGADPPQLRSQRAALHGRNGALYHPWLRVRSDGGEPELVPPCGHVAGAYARTDARAGVHKPPANEVLNGVLDVAAVLPPGQQADLNSAGVNLIRAFPGRGVRVWGARTLSADPAWAHVNVVRLVLTMGRWLERRMAGFAFAENAPPLWARIRRELTAYCDELHRSGALRGQRPDEAYFVRCDEETNDAEVRALGAVVAEVGLAPALPGELLVVRIMHSDSGVSVSPAATT